MTERARAKAADVPETPPEQVSPTPKKSPKVRPGPTGAAAKKAATPRQAAPRRVASKRQDAHTDEAKIAAPVAPATEEPAAVPVDVVETVEVAAPEPPPPQPIEPPPAALASLDADDLDAGGTIDLDSSAEFLIPSTPRRPVMATVAAKIRRAAKDVVWQLTKPRGANAEVADAAERSNGKRQLFSIGKSIKPPVVLAFTRQLASFLEAGIPVIDALEVVATQTGSSAMRIVVEDIRDAILRGTSMVDAIGAHPKVFPAYYRSMIVSAEYTGNLDGVLNQLASYLERDISARRQVKSALTYPTMVLIVASLAMTAMAVYVLPKFTMLYRNLGAKLPLPTRMLIAFTDFMSKAWPMLFGIVSIALIGSVFFLGGRRGKARRDAVMMKTPLIGRLFHMISLERFCRVLSALATAGVPLPEAIGVSADSTNNSLFRRRMADVRDTLIRGGGISEPMAETGLFPIAAKQMIQVGEKTGSLGRQMNKAASYYEREVSFTMKRTTELFEPMVILAVGLIVGFVAVAQVSAMYSIFGKVK
jgi:type IV pilus assembly protein PilC